MKIIITFIFIIFLSVSLSGQKVTYSISAGNNYSFFSGNINKDFIDPEITSFQNYSEIKRKGGFGFFVDNNFTFKINKHIGFKTCLGLRMNSFEIVNNSRYADMSYFTGVSPETLYNDRQPFIVPNSIVITGDSAYDSTSMHNYWDSTGLTYMYVSKFNIFTLSIPVQMQISLFKEKLDISSGFTVFTLLYERNVSSNFDSTENQFKNFFISTYLGADYKIYKNFYAGLSYEINLSDLIKSSSFYNQYFNNFSLRFTYKF